MYANPLGIDGFTWAGVLIGLGTAVSLAAAISTAVAVIVRFRRSSGEERQQMRVLAFVASLGGAGLVTTIAFGLLGDALGIDSSKNIFIILFSLTLLSVFVGIPVAYLVAIFRYRLWDLDVVIKKAVVALALTVLIGLPALVFLAVFSQLFIRAVPNRIYTLAGGVALGLLVLPILRLARRIATRVTFGRRATQYEVLTAFGERVGETYATEDVLPRMAHLLASGTGATSARILLRVGSELREEARWPAGAPDPHDEHVVPVVDQGEELGALGVSMPASDPMNEAKEKLVRDLAAQAGLVLRNVRLIEELRASRQRLVAVQDEERRKIERNIHDGAQQQLVALTVKLRLAQGLVSKDVSKAEAMLGELQSETQGALEDLRDLARGIYPPLLADQGLGAALEAQARRAAVPTTVEADGIGRYHQDVESAVYFCTLEALNNVSKYAKATSAEVRLAKMDGYLTFEVRDDGAGFDVDARRHGTGLQGMADRLDAIGGTLEIRSSPGSGASVMGRVPVRSDTDS